MIEDDQEQLCRINSGTLLIHIEMPKSRQQNLCL